MVTNPYKILDIPETATDEEVKSAYRKLAKKYHPDKYVDSPLKDVADEKMKEINEAYDMIMDMRKIRILRTNHHMVQVPVMVEHLTQLSREFVS